jgi:hypothetical protein
VKLLLLLGAVAVLAAGCGSSASKTLATVGGTRITQEQVDALVDRGREEAVRERRDFPAAGSEGYAALQREALGLLVYRTQVETAAQRRLGIVVSEAAARRGLGMKPERHKELVERVFEGTIGALGIEEHEDEEGPLRISDARLQLTLAALVRRLGADRVQAWIEQARRSVPVRYA